MEAKRIALTLHDAAGQGPTTGHLALLGSSSTPMQLSSEESGSGTGSPSRAQKPLRVLLADKDLVFRQRLRTLLERDGGEVVGEAADGLHAVRLAERLRPDVAILDLAMSLLNGVDAAKEILRLSPGTRAILLTMHDEDRYVTEALRAGITGYVLKTRALESLPNAIRQVARGRIYLNSDVSREVVHSSPSPDPLTARERQVLQLIAEGKTTKEVAATLGVSVKTVDSHRTQIMNKLNLRGTAALVRYAIRRGLIRP